MRTTLFALTLTLFIFVENSTAQTSHRVTSSFGMAHLPLAKESPSRKDEIFEKGWNMFSLSARYSTDKWPVEIYYNFIMKNKLFGEYERGLIYTPGASPEMSKIHLNYNFLRINYGFNLFLFKPDVGLIMEDPKEGYSSSSSTVSKKKKRIFNPFVGIGVSYTKFHSGLRMQTNDYNSNLEIGHNVFFDFKNYVSSMLFYSFGFEVEIFRSRNNKKIPFPSWNTPTYYFRYTTNYQKIPNIYIHTESSLSQDFKDNYHPFMDSYNSGPMIKVPFSNWSHFFEFAMVGTFNYKAGKKRTELMKSLRDKEIKTDNEIEG